MSNDFRSIRASEKRLEQRRLAGSGQSQSQSQSQSRSRSPFPSGYIPKPLTRLDRAEGAMSRVAAGIHMLIALAFTNVFVVLVIAATPYIQN